MSRVPYTINIEEYICSSLEYIRKMHETRDYSGLLSEVEHIQKHANRMESAIHESFTKKCSIQNVLRDKVLDDTAKFEKIKDIMGRQKEYDEWD